MIHANEFGVESFVVFRGGHRRRVGGGSSGREESCLVVSGSAGCGGHRIEPNRIESMQNRIKETNKWSEINKRGRKNVSRNK